MLTVCGLLPHAFCGGTGAEAGVDGALAQQKKLEASVSTLPTVVDNQKLLAVGAADRAREQSAATTPVPGAKRMGTPSPL